MYDYNMIEEIRKELSIQNLNDIVDYRCNWTEHLLRMKYSKVSANVHSSWQKKHWSTKRKMETITYEGGTSLDG